MACGLGGIVPGDAGSGCRTCVGVRSALGSVDLGYADVLSGAVLRPGHSDLQSGHRSPVHHRQQTGPRFVHTVGKSPHSFPMQAPPTRVVQMNPTE